MAGTDTLALQRLNYDSSFKISEHNWLKDVLNNVQTEVEDQSKYLGARQGLSPALAKLWYLSELADGLKARIQLAAAEAVVSGASMADVGRATGKSPSNIKRDFTQLDDIIQAITDAHESYEPIDIQIGGWGIELPPHYETLS